MKLWKIALLCVCAPLAAQVQLGRNVQIGAGGTGGGCSTGGIPTTNGSVTGDSSSTNCGTDNRSGDTASVPANVQTFGHDAGTGNKATETVLIGDTPGANLNPVSGSDHDLIGIGDFVLDCNLLFCNEGIAIGDSVANLTAGSNFIGLGNGSLSNSFVTNTIGVGQGAAATTAGDQPATTADVIALGNGAVFLDSSTTPGDPIISFLHDVIGVGNGAGSHIQGNSHDILGMGDGAGANYATGTHDIVAAGNGAGSGVFGSKPTLADIVALGDNVCPHLGTGSSDVFCLGHGITPASLGAVVNNAIGIGSGITLGSNQTIIGNSSTTQTDIYGTTTIHGAGTINGLDVPEGTAGSGTAGHDKLWADATSHCWMISNNGGSGVCIPTSAGGTFPSGNGIATVSNGAGWGPTIPEVPVENYGAVGYTTKAAAIAGTDSTAAIQSCLNALTAGQCRLQALYYKITSALSITHSSVGIAGVASGSTIGTLGITPSPSYLVSTSASANMITVAGTGPTANIAYNRFQNFTLGRSVVPTGTATGLSLNYTYAVVVDGVTSEDSVRCFYVHASGSLASGIANSFAIFGYGSVTETAGDYYGWYLDSADGIVSPSMMYSNDAMFSALSGVGGVTTHAFYVSGSAINDINVDDLNIANASYGIELRYTGSGALDSNSDIHFQNTTIDQPTIAGIYINSGTSALQAGSSVRITGGYVFTQQPSAPAIVITGSSGVEIGSMMLGGSPVIQASSSDHLNIHDNEALNIPAAGFTFTSVTDSNVAHNLLKGVGGSTTGISFDTASTSITGISSNTVTGAFTTPLTASTSNVAVDQSNFNGGYGQVISNSANTTGSYAYQRVCAGVVTTVSSQANCSGYYALGSAFAGSGMTQPLSTYFASATGLTGGLYFNTEAVAPLVLGTHNTAALTIDGTTQGATFAGLITQPLTTPASSSAACRAGTITADAGFVYVCTATNTWKRTALSTF